MTRKHKVFKQLNTVINNCVKNIDYFVYRPQKDFTRNRKLNSQAFIRTTLNMKGNSLSKELMDAFPEVSTRMTVSAYEQQKAKVDPKLFQYLLYTFNATLSRPALYHGYRLLAIDGSDFALPYDTNSPYLCMIQKKKPLADGTQLPTKGVCMVHANFLYDIVNYCYLDCYLQSRKQMDERSAALHMIQNLQLHRHFIVLMDRGYESFNLFEHGNRLQNCNYVIRLRATGKGGIREILELPDQACDRDITFIVTNNAKQKQLHPEYHKVNVPNRRYKDKYSSKYRTGHWDFENTCPIHFRIVKFRINNSDSGKGEWEVLATNLKRQEFSLNEMKKLYHMRWDIESSFRKLKYDLSAVSFHSKKPAFQAIELYSQLIMFNVVNRITSHIQISRDNRKWVYEIDFKMVTAIVRKYYTMPRNGDSKQMAQEIKRYIHPIRKNRQFKRNLRSQGAVGLNYRIV